jgi:carboxyl-terminal processing protease
MRLTEEEAQAQLVERPTAGGIIQKLGWITVPSFYGESDNSINATSVTRDVTMLLKRLERGGIQGVVLDLRNNGGGSVDEAVRMIGLFINPGPIAQLKDSDGAIHMVRGRLGKAFTTTQWLCWTISGLPRRVKSSPPRCRITGGP